MKALRVLAVVLLIFSVVPISQAHYSESFHGCPAHPDRANMGTTFDWFFRCEAGFDNWTGHDNRDFVSDNINESGRFVGMAGGDAFSNMHDTINVQDNIIAGSGNDIVADDGNLDRDGDIDKVCDGDGFDQIDVADGDGLDTIYAADDNINDDIFKGGGDNIIVGGCPL